MSQEGLAGIPTSASKEASTCKPVPEVAVLQHKECWFNCKKKKEVMDEVFMLPGL